jgi:hypothetical protein
MWIVESPTPSPAGECDPPMVLGGGGAHTLAGEGVGGSQFGRGDRHSGTIGMYDLYVLCERGIEVKKILLFST